MNEEYSTERAIVFVDGNNLYHSLKENGWRTWTDIGLLAERLVGNRTLVHIYYYNAPPPGSKPHTEKGNAYLSRVKKHLISHFVLLGCSPLKKPMNTGGISHTRKRVAIQPLLLIWYL